MDYVRRVKSVSSSGSFDVELLRYLPTFAYLVNSSIGTPGQTVYLELDTGSSDVWAFGADACSSSSLCVGGQYDPNRSSTATITAKGAFQIRYVTPGSEVRGDFVKDDLSLGNATITGLNMAVATYAAGVENGLMGVGFPADESNSTKYPNFVDQMVQQGLAASHSYSVWLDDIYNATGSILFGGYNSDKYHNELVALPMQPNQNGSITEMAVQWTSFSITDDTNGEGKQLTGPSFNEYAVLDTGTNVVLLPDELYTELADLAQVGPDRTVNCELRLANVSFNFGFGGPNGANISVPLYEFILPLFFPNGTWATYPNGTYICFFGMAPQNGSSILLGQPMLRAAYVVYNLDDKWIAIGATNFKSTTSNVQEIRPHSSLPAGWSSAPNITGSQTATGSPNPGSSTPAGASTVVSTPAGGSGSVSSAVVSTPAANSGSAATVTATPAGGGGGGTTTVV
ncbi:aspartic peptidase domain-containing protein [Aspergillus bertholletiae]|uniref:Aspartic peptidase domain-containing protein n=1 Tax=Aspergillus bertholletiae TaxID=1226010 RepID=A0A5N7B8V9_9EURO|nr:aspartic peptidase domain-containing protein [Aspergillus bertholletiae]